MPMSKFLFKIKNFVVVFVLNWTFSCCGLVAGCGFLGQWADPALFSAISAFSVFSNGDRRRPRPASPSQLTTRTQNTRNTKRKSVGGNQKPGAGAAAGAPSCGCVSSSAIVDLSLWVLCPPTSLPCGKKKRLPLWGRQILLFETRALLVSISGGAPRGHGSRTRRSNVRGSAVAAAAK